MKFRTALPSIAFVALLACSCAAPRQEFNAQTGSGLVLGTTSVAETHKLLGAPHDTESTKNWDGQLTLVNYRYNKVLHNGDPATDFLALTFKENLLQGYCFRKVAGNELQRDVKIDPLLEKLTKGTSTQANVTEILGEPTGKNICRSMPIDSKDHLVQQSELWYWIQRMENRNHYRAVNILFDDKGIVSEIYQSEYRPN